MLVWMTLLGTAGLFTQCKDSGSELVPDDENELITSVNLHFQEVSSGQINTFQYKDPDGEGGNAPIQFDTIRLKPESDYLLSIELLDESKSPTHNITEEVAEKSDEHLFIYKPAPATLLNYTYGDSDKNGIKVGLTKGAVRTNQVGNGTLKVQLRHQMGTKDGSETAGSDDVNLDFVLQIQ
jgi:hypothetical protein